VAVALAVAVEVALVGLAVVVVVAARMGCLVAMHSSILRSSKLLCNTRPFLAAGAAVQGGTTYCTQQI
jgi:hypothetical protein